MKRAKHNLSHYRMHTLDMGEFVPIACVPVLPGDTVQHSSSALVRVAPLNTPVMHPVAVRMHHFFVPNRIVWPESENGGWEQFITGGPDGNNQESPPTVKAPQAPKNLLHYLGVPVDPEGTRDVNGLALRATNLIWNEYYRDQDIESERPLESTSVPKIAWEKDYFTTARPWASKGPEITLPIGQYAPVLADADLATPGELVSMGGTDGNQWGMQQSGPGIDWSGGVNPSDPSDLHMVADLGAGSQININDFRAGFALQRYQEARARYGSRFTEYLRYLGITPSDARLQRPEYLGGGSTRLSFSEVLQTTPGAEGEVGVGDLYGHGIAGIRSNAYRKFFEEHGYIITVLSVRPKAIYENGCHREFLKTTKEDYFQKELANLGQQDVLMGELFLAQEDYRSTFGFQDRYDEYRQHWSFVGNDFRSVLNSWHLARDLDANVALNQDFIRCDPSKRIYQVETGDSLWAMINHKVVARRLVSKRAYPRIL